MEQPIRTEHDFLLTLNFFLLTYLERMLIIRPPDDSWLLKLRSAQDGDCAALGEILAEFWQPLWNQACTSLDADIGRDQAASDLVQETLMDAQRAIAQFRGTSRGEFVAWLRTIMRNNLLEARRSHMARKQRHAHASQLQANNSRPHASQAPLDRLISDEQKALLESVLKQLPEHYQIVLRLRYWESMTYEQIGQRIGKSADSTRQIWYRAISLATELLSKHVTNGK